MIMLMNILKEVYGGFISTATLGNSLVVADAHSLNQVSMFTHAASTPWIIEKARKFQKNIYICFIDYPKPLTVWITTNCGKSLKRWEYQTTLPIS